MNWLIKFLRCWQARFNSPFKMAQQTFKDGFADLTGFHILVKIEVARKKIPACEQQGGVPDAVLGHLWIAKPRFPGLRICKVLRVQQGRFHVV
jgi:hypothetical protein